MGSATLEDRISKAIFICIEQRQIGLGSDKKHEQLADIGKFIVIGNLDGQRIIVDIDER